MERRPNNGTSLPTTEPRPNIASLQGGHIAAVDFGTTCCSLAYCLKGDLDNMKLKRKVIKLDGINVRAPSALLINDEGTVIKFGRNAEAEWNSVCRSFRKREKNFFFKQIKMTLLRGKETTIMTTIQAANGRECFLIEVIAIMLRYIKDKLITVELKGNSHGIKDTSDFNWVITVPAIWEPRAKQIMREAAYMAGIASKGPVIAKLTAVEKTFGIGSPQYLTAPAKVEKSNTNPDQLSLALEPEGAALYCMHETEQSNDDELKKLKRCLVADIGGGTVDITALTREGSDKKRVQVDLAPAGNAHGGTTVNRAILEFIGKLVEDPDFKEFKKNKYYIQKMLQLEQEIEDKKTDFGNSLHRDDIAIILPDTFMDTYASPEDSDSESDTQKNFPLDHIKDTIEGVHLDEQRLEISYEKMEEFFKPAVDGILSCIQQCLRQVRGKVEAMFLVGGFGGCSYIHNKIKPVIENEFSCKVYTAPEHTTAVVAGAVMFRKDPEIFSARVADASYGTTCQVKFDRDKYDHSIDYRIFDDDGVAQCNHLFSAMVTNGQSLQRDKVITKHFVPGSHGMDNMHFCILATENKQPYYSHTPKGILMPDVHNIGNVTVSMPDPTGDKSRRVKLTFDFSNTEIQVHAHDLTSGKMAATVVDFL